MFKYRISSIIYWTIIVSLMMGMYVQVRKNKQLRVELLLEQLGNKIKLNEHLLVEQSRFENERRRADELQKQLDELKKKEVEHTTANELIDKINRIRVEGIGEDIEYLQHRTDRAK